MTLTSLSFFALVLASLIVYYICPKKFRWIVLLLASLAFYGIVCLKYIPFIIFTTVSTWLGGLWLQKYSDRRKAELKAGKAEWDSETKKKFKHQTMIGKRLILCLFLLLNFGILAALKYYNFIADWVGGLVGITFPMIGILLPLGISFYTFQTMGYIIDVYWEKTAPEKNLARFGLFTTFFPQIVQGPIAIYDDLAGQLYEGHELKYENIKYGFQLILWGLFKKMVIADRMLVAINAILPQKNELSNFYSLFALLFYAAQLYADFSGGIDIARGVAEMFGITMAKNFERPYFSKSVSEFWRRWHISLGHWLRTYLFYPIAVSKAFIRFGKWISRFNKKEDYDLPDDSIWGGFPFFQHLGRVFPGCIATIITFFVIGMWHGANWRYAGFGLWNGIVILFAMLLEPVFRWLLKRLHVRTESFSWRLWQIIRTFVLVMVGFVFDLGDNFADSVLMVKKCFTPTLGGGIDGLKEFMLSFGLEKADYIIILAGLLIVFFVSLYQERSKKSVRETLDGQQIWFQWVVTFALLLCIVLFGVYGPGISAGEFVYMQF